MFFKINLLSRLGLTTRNAKYPRLVRAAEKFENFLFFHCTHKAQIKASGELVYIAVNR